MSMATVEGTDGLVESLTSKADEKKPWWSLTSRPKSDQDYHIPVYLTEFNVKGLSGIHSLRVCLAVSVQNDEPQLFEMDVVYATVERAWKIFGEKMHTIASMTFLVYVITITATNFLFHTIIWENSAWQSLLIFLDSVIITLSVGFLGLEIRQTIYEISNNNFLDYFNENFVDWLAYSLTLIGCLIRCVAWLETNTSAAVMAVATLFVYLKGLDYLRPYKATGPTIRMVFAILGQTLPLLAILLLINIGFSQSFYLLSQNNPSLDSYTPQHSMLFTYIYMTGQANWSDMFHTSSPGLALFLMGLFIALTTILVLNLLIAKMNNVYGEVECNTIGEWKREQCKLIIEYSLICNFEEIFPDDYMYALMRKEYAEHREEILRDKNCNRMTLEEVENIRKLLKEQNREVKQLKEQMGNLMNLKKENVSSIAEV